MGKYDLVKALTQKRIIISKNSSLFLSCEYKKKITKIKRPAAPVSVRITQIFSSKFLKNNEIKFNIRL